MNLNGVEYYYIRNNQGDIIGLHDSAGVEVVNYSYDSWGKLISTTGTRASDVGDKNPYRYRGYRYDTETSLYYLQSRYYNADWGRFINGDDANTVQIQQGELLAANMFAYCGNNPVNYNDPTGYWLPTWVKNTLKSIISVFCKDFRDNTLTNMASIFGGGFIGGLSAFNSVKAANKLTLFTKKNPLMPTLIGVFKGMLAGFLTGEGGAISGVLGKTSKYADYEGAFDRTSIGKWIDNKIYSIELYLNNMITYRL